VTIVVRSDIIQYNCARFIGNNGNSILIAVGGVYIRQRHIRREDLNGIPARGWPNDGYIIDRQGAKPRIG
jgi:hypothetical protein